MGSQLINHVIFGHNFHTKNLEQRYSDIELSQYSNFENTYSNLLIALSLITESLIEYPEKGLYGQRFGFIKTNYTAAEYNPMKMNIIV